ncbi:MAG: efflux RND transporter periplasmic adaptor subunit [Bacteroidota bacterium]
MKNWIVKSTSLLVVAVLGGSCDSTETTLPEQVNIVDAVFASGQVILENEYLVTARAEGYLIASRVVEGDSIRQGTPLFQLSSEVENEQLVNAQATYQDALQNMDPKSPQQVQIRLQIEQAQAQLVLDENTQKRYNKLIGSGAVSKAEYDRVQLQYENSKLQVAILEKSLKDLIEQLALKLKNAETQLNIQKENVNDFYLSSAISGVVLHLYKEEGELVRRGEAIAKVGGGQPIAQLFIAEQDINSVRLGQEVAVALNTNPHLPKKARISRIYPAFDNQEQSFVCEAQFEQTPKLYANTQLQANIIIDQRDQALAIPADYLLDGDRVLTDDGRYLALNVGIRNGDWVEVVSGLEASEVIIKAQK